MNDIIHLLPDSVSNQIAAGEVVQRPASVVKELIENAIDAGASNIQVIVKDAGRTLIQVIDNGLGMSGTDARMAFERHATSKITSAQDLFALFTMGFRGEALPSIAAVAQVELKTRRSDAELGVRICIAGSQIESQEPVNCASGSNFMVKNLFFNVPARRKFLKSDNYEFLHILAVFQQMALVNPEVHFSLVNNDIEVFNLPPASIRQRIVKIFGKSIHQQKHLNQQLLNIEFETTLAKITGFIGKPEIAKKRNGEQYFFVNGRYMRHPYFHKAVMQAFEPFIPQGCMPTYFIYFTVDPSTIDVNIHPTKTEIKFENEQAIWPILSAVVKEALGKFNVAPSIDFDRTDAPDIPIYSSKVSAAPPQPKFNTDYNPFKTSSPQYKRPSMEWEKLYEGFEKEKSGKYFSPDPNPDPIDREPERPPEDRLFAGPETSEAPGQYLWYKGKYVLTSVKSGLMFIDLRRAHIRVLYQEYLMYIRQKKGVSQRVLFPEVAEFTPEESALLPLLSEDLHYMGFELNDMGNNAFAVTGIPSGISGLNPVEVIKDMIYTVREKGSSVKDEWSESLALSLAKNAAFSYGKNMTEDEIRHLIDALFATGVPNYTPDGKTILSVLSDEEIGNRFK
ncbi:MAG: DNA mismatch repair endonuclease MutL [Candidatus Azobacteroides sp.]|nr:DNA mismatch repair endonuclease MutL [Candidatus Azobacteroides sp.]